MKKFLIIAGMIMCFILGGCSVRSVDAKESNSNDNEYIGQMLLSHFQSL